MPYLALLKAIIFLLDNGAGKRTRNRKQILQPGSDFWGIKFRINRNTRESGNAKDKKKE